MTVSVRGRVDIDVDIAGLLAPGFTSADTYLTTTKYLTSSGGSL